MQGGLDGSTSSRVGHSPSCRTLALGLHPSHRQSRKCQLALTRLCAATHPATVLFGFALGSFREQSDQGVSNDGSALGGIPTTRKRLEQGEKAIGQPGRVINFLPLLTFQPSTVSSLIQSNPLLHFAEPGAGGTRNETGHTIIGAYLSILVRLSAPEITGPVSLACQ